MTLLFVLNVTCINLQQLHKSYLNYLWQEIIQKVHKIQQYTENKKNTVFLLKILISAKISKAITFQNEKVFVLPEKEVMVQINNMLKVVVYFMLVKKFLKKVNSFFHENTWKSKQCGKLEAWRNNIKILRSERQLLRTMFHLKYKT